MLGLPNFLFYLIAGVIGAFAISFGRWLGEKFIPNFPDMPLLLGRLIDWGKPEPEHTARVMGGYLHLTTGALWGLLFGIVVEKQFFLVELNIAQGIMFAAIPWIFLMVVIMPLARGGFFGLKAAKYFWLTSLALHALYGAVLGGLLSIFINKPF
jgi:hypothetical protein